MKISKQRGIALPLVMIAIMIGAIIIPAFVGRVGNGLVASRNYRNTMDTQYACDSGAEHAIWNLAEGGLENDIPDAGDYINYSLDETINNLTTNVKVSNAWEVIAWDNFNSGDWTGGEGWLGNWSYSGEALVTATGTPYEGGYHLRLRSNTGIASRAIDLSKQINAHLYFWAKAISVEAGESVVCRISHNGTDWTTIYTWTEAVSDSTYHYYDINLTPYGLTSVFYVSFAANMSGIGDYFYVDDLQLVWPASSLTLVSAEDFETGDWTGGTGWLGDWTHTGTSSVNSAGTPYGGNYHLLIQDIDGYAARAVDLSEQAVARLQFWAKAYDFEGGDYAYCRVSSNGVDWDVAYTWSNADDDNIYHYYDIEITDYGLSGEFWIAFSAGMNRADDYFYVDDISINAIRAYCITVTAGDRILKVAVDLMGGQKTILGWWLIV